MAILNRREVLNLDKPLYYTAQEAATILRWQKPNKIYILCRCGILKAFKRGRIWLIDAEEFEKWRKAQVGLLVN